MITQCKECAGKVSDQAKSCPHCGAPLKLGLFAGLGKWFSELKPEKLKTAERKAKRVKSFTFDSCPFSAPHNSINHTAIRHKLLKAKTFRETQDALSEFPSPAIGYAANKPWLTEWVELRPALWVGSNRVSIVDVLFAAFCFDDKELCDSLIQEGYVLNKELALDVLCRFARISAEDKVKAFIKRYVDLSDENKKYFAANIHWLKIIDSGDTDVIAYFKGQGVDIRIGDDGLERYKHVDYDKFYSWTYTSPLLQAIEKNNVARVKFLLDWGANPNQRLYISAGRDNDWVLHLDPLLTHIRSREIFDLMVAAGMELYPAEEPEQAGSRRYNLVETLWMSKTLSQPEVDFMNYLYDIGYDKPLVNRIADIQNSLDNHEGRPYQNNIKHVHDWITREQTLR